MLTERIFIVVCLGSVVIPLTWRVAIWKPSNPVHSRCSTGGPLSPLLFSLVILELLDSLDSYSGLHFQLWYMDDGSFVGNRESISSLLQSLLAKVPIFGMHINVNKCELYWSSGDRTFPEFPSEVRRLSEGIKLLGSPVDGSVEFFKVLHS